MTLSATEADTSSCSLTETWWAPSDLIGLVTTIVRLSTPSPETAAIASAMSVTVTAPNRRPPAPERTFTSTGPDSSLALISAAWSWSRTEREERAALIDSTCFWPPRVQRIATPRGTR